MTRLNARCNSIQWICIDLEARSGEFGTGQGICEERKGDRVHLGWLFWQTAQQHADRILWRTANESHTYGWVLARSLDLADYLIREAGLAPQDRVALLQDNSVQYIVSLLGTLLAGGIAVPLSTATESDRLASQLELVEPHVVVMDVSPRVRTRLSWLPVGRQVPVGAGPPPRHLPRPASSHDPAMILCTSGSTGAPKGVALSHRNLVSNARSIALYLNIQAQDKALCIVPFQHAFGNSILTSHLLVGGELVVDGSMSFPISIVHALQRHGITSISGVPEQVRYLTDHGVLGQHALPYLRYVAVAGGALSPDRALSLSRQLAPSQLYLMYGQTEATARLSYLPPEELDRRPGSIGKGMPGVCLGVANEAGQAARPGEVGELRARGPGIMIGYWGDPAATQAVLRQGWLYTGDLACQDAEGWITLMGRASSWVKIAGHRVHPAEIEQFVKNVLQTEELAVVPFPVQPEGLRLALFVMQRPGLPAVGPSQLMAACRAGLPAHQVPVLVDFLTVLPQTTAGKVDLAALSHRAAAQYVEPFMRDTA